MGCKAVLFDIDGTLVDSNGAHVDAWVEAFEENGYRFDRDAIRAQIGKGADNLVPDLISGADAKLAKALGDRHGEVFKGTYLEQVKPFPHARELVARVHDAGRTVVIASSASQAELDHYLQLLDLKPLVDGSTVIDEVQHSKPAPDIFLLAQQKAKVADAGEVVVIGDSPWDMVPARYCGMRTIALRSGGFGDAELREAGADAIFDNVAEVLARFGETAIAG